MKSIIFIIAISLLFATSGYCATYYVDKGGSDSAGTGSKASPWNTISFALRSVGYGDLVSINDGTYTETRLVVPPGVSMMSTSKNNTKVRVQPASSLGAYSPFVSLSSNTPGSKGTQTISHIEFSGVNGGVAARAGILVQNRDDVRIHHCHIHDFKGANGSYGVQPVSTQIPRTNKWWEFHPSDVERPGVDSQLNALWPANPVENFELDNNLIVDCGHRDTLGSGSLYPAVYPYNLKNSSIHDNVIDAVGSRGECIYATSAILWNVDIYNNDLSMAQYTDRSSYIIEIWNLRGGCEIYNNTANTGFSIAMGKETKVYRNEIIFNPLASAGGAMGIEFIGQGEGAVYENFVSGAGVYGIDAGLDWNMQSRSFTLRNTTIRNNVIHRPKGSGICLMAIASKTRAFTNTVDGFNIYNNTVDDSRSSSSGYGLIRMHQSNGPTGYGIMNNISVINNLLLNSPSSAGIVDGNVSNLVVKNNGYWGNSRNSFSGVSDQDRIVSDPQLVGASGQYAGYEQRSQDFIDTGIDVGFPFNGSKPDIGAFEVTAFSPLIGIDDTDTATGSNTDLSPPSLFIVPN